MGFSFSDRSDAFSHGNLGISSPVFKEGLLGITRNGQHTREKDFGVAGSELLQQHSRTFAARKAKTSAHFRLFKKMQVWTQQDGQGFSFSQGIPLLRDCAA